MERRVRLDERGTSFAVSIAQAVLEAPEVLVGEARRREPRRFRLEDRRTWWISSSDPARRQVADETDAGQEEVRLERRDVGAVPDAGLEDAHERERADALAERAAGDAEPLRQLSLRRQPCAGLNSPELISSLSFAIA